MRNMKTQRAAKLDIFKSVGRSTEFEDFKSAARLNTETLSVAQRLKLLSKQKSHAKKDLEMKMKVL